MIDTDENQHRLARLSGFASALRWTDMPEADRAATRAATLYGLAVGTASAEAGLLDQIARAVEALAPNAQQRATCFRDGARGGVEGAALANGALLHVRMQEDAHPAGHVGVAVIPAAIAAAEDSGCSGAALLAAIAAGFEVSLRIGRDHAASLSARGFRTTPIYGAIGAAVAAARVQGLDGDATARAISLAANMGGGLREFQEAGTFEYALHAGCGARDGLVAASLAAAGVPAARTVLSGKAGFYRAFGADDPDPGARLLDELGTAFEIQHLTYKPFPGGQFHRCIVEGVGALRARAEGRAVAAIRVRLHPFVANFYGLRFTGPYESYPQAFYSVPFCAALTWLDGTVSFRGFHRFEDAALLALVAKTSVVDDDSRPVYGPRIEIDLGDGETLVYEEPEGQGAYRLTWDKAVMMAQRFGHEVGISEAAVARLVAAVAALEDAAGTGELVDAMCAAVRESLT
jgi:2-methylcitrate dehydratase PrpD